MAILVLFIILVSYVSFSQFIARCHGNQKEGIWPKWPKNVKRHFLHIHISNNTPNFDSDLHMLLHFSSKGVDYNNK